MILVFGGTTEANNLTDALLRKGHSVTVSCATRFGQEKVPSPRRGEKQSEGGLKVVTGQLNTKDIINLLTENNYKAVIDATHPFAVSISQNTKQACEKTTTPYFRLERQNTQIITNGLVIKVKSFEEAAKKALKLGKRIFLTIGANNIKVFSKQAQNTDSAIIARVLNQQESVKKCQQAGVEKEFIIAENGLFSTAQNIEHFLKYEAEVVVSKDSGIAGGLTEKVKACAQLDIPLILIQRPQRDEDAYYDIDDLVKQVSKN